MQLLYGMIGSCAAGIPLAAVLLFQIHSNAALTRQINRYEQHEQNGLYLYVWTLKHDIAAGEKITRADLEQKKVWVLQTDHPERSMDPEQITGKKAVRDLKKGTVMDSSLLSDKKKSKKAATDSSSLT